MDKVRKEIFYYYIMKIIFLYVIRQLTIVILKKNRNIRVLPSKICEITLKITWMEKTIVILLLIL